MKERDMRYGRTARTAETIMEKSSNDCGVFGSWNEHYRIMCGAMENAEDTCREFSQPCRDAGNVLTSFYVDIFFTSLVSLLSDGASEETAAFFARFGVRA
jgi:hypothetical protein